MSYILDALKRAETERNGAAVARGALPAAFMPSPTAPDRHVALLLALGLVLGGIVLGAFVLDLWRTESKAMPASAPLAPAASLAAPAAEPVRHETVKAAVIIPPPAAFNAPAAPSAPAKIAATEKPVLRPAAADPAPPRTVAKPLAVAAAPAASPPALGTLRDLPDHIQREIPPLAVSGFLYAANPADRSVLINNRLRREGDEVAPGLLLEALQSNGMVLSYRGHRYRSTY